MKENPGLPTYMGSPYEQTSSKVAKERLKNMHNKDNASEPKVHFNGIANECPPDNNVYWEGNHNPLSSKGD
ncbi:hypothetical protein ACTQ6A_03295 [Lachnospiraceae bacterium LCP25S3_G4]